MIKLKTFFYKGTVSSSADKCQSAIADWQKENGIKDDAIISISAIEEDSGNGFLNLRTNFLVTYSD